MIIDTINFSLFLTGGLLGPNTICSSSDSDSELAEGGKEVGLGISFVL